MFHWSVVIFKYQDIRDLGMLPCFLFDALESLESETDPRGFAQAKQMEKCFETLEEMEAQGLRVRLPKYEMATPI